jgi:hypothetical protein
LLSCSCSWKSPENDDHDEDLLHKSDKIHWDGSRIVVAVVVVVAVAAVVVTVGAQLLPTKQTVLESSDVIFSVTQKHYN